MPKKRIGGRVVYVRQINRIQSQPTPPPVFTNPGTPIAPPISPTPQTPPVQTPPAQAQPTPQPTPQQVASGNVLPPGGIPFSQFEKMTYDQKADVISKALQNPVPMFLDDSGTQRFAYFTGMSDKPTIMTEAQLQAMPGRDLWRSVAASARSNYNAATDISYSGQAIYNQLATGDFTKYSDTGGSAFGKAIYFDVQRGSYGSGNNYTIMHAKYLPTAKTISYATASRNTTREITSGSKLGNVLQSANSRDRVGLWALAHGYDAVIDSGNSNYNMVLNRRCLALSDKTF